MAKKLYILFVFHGAFSEDDEKKAMLIIQNLKSQFFADYESESFIARYDFSEKIPKFGQYIYLYEPDFDLEPAIVIYVFRQTLSMELLGKIHPHLRALKFDIDEHKKIFYFWFYFDCEMSDEERSFVRDSTAFTSLWPDYKSIIEAENIGSSCSIPFMGMSFYRRYEA